MNHNYPLSAKAFKAFEIVRSLTRNPCFIYPLKAVMLPGVPKSFGHFGNNRKTPKKFRYGFFIRMSQLEKSQKLKKSVKFCLNSNKAVQIT